MMFRSGRANENPGVPMAARQPLWLAFSGAPRSMKMGTIASPRRYDAEAFAAH
jgi:hypothetical protein